MTIFGGRYTSMKEKKFRSLGINAFLNALKQGISILFPLITYPYAFRVLHAEGIGKVDYASSIVGYFSLFASLGISTYMIREGAKCRNNKAELEKLSNQCFTFNILTTILSYVALLIFLFLFKPLQSYRGLIVISSLSIAFTTCGIEWVNTIYEDYLYITIRSIITHVVSLILLYALVKDADDYYWYAFLSVATNGIICVMNWIYCRKYIHLKLTRHLNIKRHIGPILTLFSNTIATKIYVSADTTMLGSMLGDYNVGLYSVAVKIYNVIKNMIAAMYIVAIPRISYYVGKGETDNIKKVFTSILSGLTLVLFPASVGLMCVAREVILFMGGNEYLDAVPTLQILSISLIGAVFGGSVVYCLNIPLGREKTNVVATTISAVINVVLNLFMIPMFKQNGAAVTTVISEFFVFFYCILTYKNLPQYIDFKAWGKNALQAVIGAGLVICVSSFVNIITDKIYISIIAKVVLSVFIYVVELLLFKNQYVYNFLRRARIIK